MRDEAQELVGPGLVVNRTSLGGLISLRAEEQTAGKIALGIGIEQVPVHLRFSQRSGATMARLGPDEYWFRFAETAPANVDHAAKGDHFALVDLSSAFQAVEVRGAHALDLLAAVCALDLHPSQASEGFVTRTLVGKAEIVLFCHETAEHFELITLRSFMPYLFALLQRAGMEFWTDSAKF